MVNVKNMKTQEFEKKLLIEDVICFCSGYGLRELCEIYPHLAGKIRYVVDNYNYGKMVTLHSMKIPVIAMNEMDENINNAMLIITSLKFADEIIRQMDTLELCNNLDVFVPALFQVDRDSVFLKKNVKELIPKKIHYCWFGKNNIPKKFEKNIDSWKRICPDYEIIRWDESNYDYRKNNYMKQAYELGKWGFVPDYARLDIINIHGGIYLDTDVELIKSLDIFLQFPLFCGFEDLWSVNFGLGFGGIANNQILQEMMELYHKMNFIRPDKTLNLTASPVYQTKILVEHGLVRNGNSQQRDDFAAFSQEYFSPFNAFGYGSITENTYSIHQYAATWFGNEEKSIKEKMDSSVRYVMKRIVN